MTRSSQPHGQTPKRRSSPKPVSGRAGDVREEAAAATLITPENVNEVVGGYMWAKYRKTALTTAAGPYKAPFPIAVQTKEGVYDLPEGWRGYIAEDADGDLYPVDEAVFERTYVEVLAAADNAEEDEAWFRHHLRDDLTEEKGNEGG